MMNGNKKEVISHFLFSPPPFIFFPLSPRLFFSLNSARRGSFLNGAPASEMHKANMEDVRALASLCIASAVYLRSTRQVYILAHTVANLKL